MGAKLLLGDAALLVLTDDLLENGGALLLDHRGGNIERHQREKLLDHIGTDGTGEIFIGVYLQALAHLFTDFLKG